MARTLAQYEIFKGEDKQWYWRLVGRNGEIVFCTSEGYTRRASAIKMAKRMPELANTTAIAEAIQ